MSILAPSVIAITVPGALASGVDVARFVAPFDMTILSVTAAVTIAPATTNVLVDVNVAGSSIFTVAANADKPVIVAAATESATSYTPTVSTRVANGTVVSVDLDTVGTTTTGSNLTLLFAVMGASS